jgi:probable F420-dependent oxidoreductase
MHPFRFGVNNTGANSLAEWQEYARKAEDLGYANLIMQDHFGPQFSPFPALMAAAAVTSRVRLTTMVLDNDFRHPAVVAKDAATVDVLTEGRLELGLGAGWMQADYDKIGLTFDPPAERMQRFKEAVSIIKGFFEEEGAVSFKGEHYNITNLDGWPASVQQPHPPLLIGGRQKRMLSFAAREADIVSISMLDPRGPDVPKPPTFATKVAWVKEAAGERYSRIELHTNSGGLVVTDNAKSAVEEAANRLKVEPADVMLNPANLIGSVDAIVEQIKAWRETCGLNYIVFPGRKMMEAAPIIARLAGR